MLRKRCICGGYFRGAKGDTDQFTTRSVAAHCLRRIELAYDPVGRLEWKTNQLGDTVNYQYDMANRLLQSDYRGRANCPFDPISDSDTFTYDAYVATTIFDATGSEISNSQISNPYTYTARRHDINTSLISFRAHYYSPTLGRFLSRDPLGFVDELSLYRGYFVANGLNPSGKARNWFDDGGCYVSVICNFVSEISAM